VDHDRGVEPHTGKILSLILPGAAVLGYLTIALLLIIPIGLRRASSG